MVMKLTAKKLNDHLANGGHVRISTQMRITTFGPEHVGFFTEDSKGDVYMAQGRKRACLTYAGGTKFLVSIKLGRMAAAK